MFHIWPIELEDLIYVPISRCAWTIISGFIWLLCHIYFNVILAQNIGSQLVGGDLLKRLQDKSWRCLLDLVFTDLDENLRNKRKVWFWFLIQQNILNNSTGENDLDKNDCTLKLILNCTVCTVTHFFTCKQVVWLTLLQQTASAVSVLKGALSILDVLALSRCPLGFRSGLMEGHFRIVFSS